MSLATRLALEEIAKWLDPCSLVLKELKIS